MIANVQLVGLTQECQQDIAGGDDWADRSIWFQGVMEHCTGGLTCTGFRMGWSSPAVGKRNFIAKDLKSL